MESLKSNGLAAELNQASSAIPVPVRMGSRPISRTGYVVPWFVTEKDENGEWDFRVIKPERVVEAFRADKCWLCGNRLGRHRVFAIGPMCAINRITSEPPCHLECVEYAVQVCPFMTRPRMRRNKADLPETAGMGTPGVMLERNPGVTLLWETQRARYSMIAVPAASGHKGFMFRFSKDDPDRLMWWAEGRPATKAEVMLSVDSGLPSLKALAEKDGTKGMREFNEAVRRSQKFFDAIPDGTASLLAAPETR